MMRDSTSLPLVQPQPDHDEVATIQEQPTQLPGHDIREDVGAGLQWALNSIGPTTVIAILPDTTTLQGKWLDGSTFPSVAAWAGAKNRQGHNLYFCPNEPQAGISTKPKNENIVRLRAAAWADVDAKDGRPLDDALATLLRLPQPDIVIFSGGGYQPIWLLPAPLPATPENVARMKKRCERVRGLTNGDSVQDIGRILRLPLTRNYPNRKKREEGRSQSVSGLLIVKSAARARQTEGQLDAALAALEAVAAPVNVVPFNRGTTGVTVHALATGSPAAVLCAAILDMNAAMSAGLPERSGFEDLTPDRQSKMLMAMLDHPAIKDIADCGRKPWLDILFACAHADNLGTPGAREAARAWSQHSTRYAPETFDRDFNSFDPDRPDGVKIGTLIAKARDTGFNTALWLGAGPPGGTPAVAPFTAAFFQPVQFAAANLHPVPWIIPGIAARGDLTVIAAPGGGAKTVLAISMLASIAAGQAGWGGMSIEPRRDGRPLRVALVSAEEDAGRVALLVAGACQEHHLDPVEQANVSANLVLHDARQSGFCIGAQKGREEISSEADDIWCAKMAAALQGVDLVVLDTLAATLALPNENDNSAATKLLRRTIKAVGPDCAVIMLHHTPKMTREAAASHRGEATAIRGGGAIVNTARAAWTIAGPSAEETGMLVAQGISPDCKRLDPVKLNDMPPPPAIFFEVVGSQVTIADGSRVSVRAIRFVASPPANGGGMSSALLNAAMRAIDTGAAIQGVTGVPLSRTATKGRSATEHVAQALRSATPSMPETHAKTTATALLKHLIDQLGCVIVADVQVPKFKPDGSANGHSTAKGLQTRWDLAPWMTGATTVVPSIPVQPSPVPPP